MHQLQREGRRDVLAGIVAGVLVMREVKNVRIYGVGPRWRRRSTQARGTKT